jgi:DNA-binding transcriptional regulator LsrR (DeoR family)
MADQLKMAMVNAIWILKERGWSQRRIARELGINRETVGKYFNLWRDGPKSIILRPL